MSYGTLAAKSRRAEIALIPLSTCCNRFRFLAICRSPSFSLSRCLPPGLGPELAAIFAIFTSQAWNMAFSFTNRCARYRPI